MGTERLADYLIQKVIKRFLAIRHLNRTMYMVFGIGDKYEKKG